MNKNHTYLQFMYVYAILSLIKSSYGFTTRGARDKRAERGRDLNPL